MYTEEYKFVVPPKPVGWWQITPDVKGAWCTKIAVYAPINERQIKNTEKLLGWKWIEGENI